MAGWLAGRGFTAALVAMLMLAAAECRGEDGVVEINQVRAMAGGITEDDTAGFPVTISESGSYRLTGDLDLRGEPEPENVIAIDVEASANQVSIDLNGFAIVGSTACGEPPFTCAPTGDGAGVRSAVGTYVTVANGNVTGMGGAGVALRGFGMVSDVHASHNGECGICVGSLGIVEGCTAASNGEEGIGVSSGVVRGNTARDNGRVGLIVRLGTLVWNNTANGNLIGGIVATDSTVGSLVVGNTVHANGGTGLALELTSAFADNVMSANVGAQALGGVEIDDNLCDGRVPCR